MLMERLQGLVERDEGMRKPIYCQRFISLKPLKLKKSPSSEVGEVEVD